MGQNDREIILYNISVDLEGERVLFHRLSSCFLKENPRFGCCGVGLFGHFGPKGALGSEKHVEKVSEDV